jgi:hypothetical protein
MTPNVERSTIIIDHNQTKPKFHANSKSLSSTLCFALNVVLHAMHVPLNIRKDIIAASLELVGTMFFLLLGLGGIQAATAETLTSDGVTNVERILCVSFCRQVDRVPNFQQLRLNVYGVLFGCLCLDFLPVRATTTTPYVWTDKRISASRVVFSTHASRFLLYCSVSFLHSAGFSISSRNFWVPSWRLHFY